MDKIFIENLSVTGKHGVMKHERELEQNFLVDIVAEFDVTLGAKSDKLSGSLDYSRLRDIARETIEEEKSVYLIEKLASLMAEKILKDRRIKNVSISIRKPSVFPSGVPGVKIIRIQKN